MAAPGSIREPTSSNESISRGLEFLLEAREPDGWWRDFETLAGPSDEWVTAYTALSIGGIPEGDSAAREALVLLKPRCRDGFGYAAHVPPDCDSTAWYCRLAETLRDTRSSEYRKSLRFLQSSLRPNGGLPAYPAVQPIREFTGLPPDTEFQGWNSTHSCVTAAVAGLAGMREETQLREFLRSVRLMDGGWCGYWWASRAYPTMLAAKALFVDARNWARNSEECSAFELACRLALGAPVKRDLLLLQLPDGSWPASAQLRIPEPQVLDPERGPFRISLDQNRIYTTAIAVRALHEAS